MSKKKVAETCARIAILPEAIAIANSDPQSHPPLQGFENFEIVRKETETSSY